MSKPYSAKPTDGPEGTNPPTGDTSVAPPINDCPHCIEWRHRLGAGVCPVCCGTGKKSDNEMLGRLHQALKDPVYAASYYQKMLEIKGRHSKEQRVQLKTVTAQRDIAVGAIRESIRVMHLECVGIGVARRQKEFRILEEALCRVEMENSNENIG